ncbi:hypothetical protein SAMN05216582_1107 [Selenomonas ruminantium]|uniref:Uncharacterized protein n=1 Tax=Selenomonas ruminantium TaxID=971 RepID=A0A1M6TZV4_SELRU|nr:hypothetical protein [Selenomonas ruminantium]SHK62430.1 hypothetical protein SAMN05216582_1107 [Selenomonas ruminantium]
MANQNETETTKPLSGGELAGMALLGTLAFLFTPLASLLNRHKKISILTMASVVIMASVFGCTSVFMQLLVGATILAAIMWAVVISFAALYEHEDKVHHHIFAHAHK